MTEASRWITWLLHSRMGKVTLVGIVWIGVIESSAIWHRAPLMAIIMIPIVLLPLYLGAFAVTTVLIQGAHSHRE